MRAGSQPGAAGESSVTTGCSGSAGRRHMKHKHAMDVSASAGVSGARCCCRSYLNYSTVVISLHPLDSPSPSQVSSVSSRFRLMTGSHSGSQWAVSSPNTSWPFNLKAASLPSSDNWSSEENRECSTSGKRRGQTANDK